MATFVRGDNLLKFGIKRFTYQSLPARQQRKRKVAGQDKQNKKKKAHTMPRQKNSRANDTFAAENETDDFVQNYTIETLPCITKMPIVGSGAPLSFLIKSIKGEYIDPNHLVMYLKFKVWKKGAAGAKTALAEGETVAPYCGFLYTLFKDVTADFNGITMYTTHQQYQHLAYLGILLNAPYSMKDSVLGAALWKQDPPGAFDLVDPANKNINPSAYWRALMIKKSKEMEMKGPLLIDCLKVSKPILDGVDIGLSFFPHDSTSCLIFHKAGAEGPPNYVIEVLEVGRIRPKQSVIPKAVYPYVHREMLHMIHDKNLTYFGPTTIANGVLPKRVIVALLTEAAYSGNIKKNRLKFRNFKVDNVVVRVNSADKPMGGGYKMTYTVDAKNYTHPYYGLFKELGQGFGDVQVGPITMGGWDSGYAIYAFDTSPGHDASLVPYGKIGTGNCELMIHFSKAANENVVVLAMLEYERKYTMLAMDSGNVRQIKFENVVT